MKNMKDYNHLYLNSDVFLLAAAFEVFGIESTNSFVFNLAHYLFTPGYSWDAMLRFVSVNLKLISCINKYQ